MERLRDGGRLYLGDVVFPSATADFDASFTALIDDVRANAGDEMARQTIRHIKAEFSTLDWILEGMIARAGLEIIRKDCKGLLTVYVCEKK
ncbi:hypothetical protein GX586_13450 [bacterium]|nr:hypothetical protein [bacterium]